MHHIIFFYFVSYFKNIKNKNILQIFENKSCSRPQSSWFCPAHLAQHSPHKTNHYKQGNPLIYKDNRQILHMPM